MGDTFSFGVRGVVRRARSPVEGSDCLGARRTRRGRAASWTPLRRYDQGVEVPEHG